MRSEQARDQATRGNENLKVYYSAQQVKWTSCKPRERENVSAISMLWLPLSLQLYSIPSWSHSLNTNYIWSWNGNAMGMRHFHSLNLINIYRYNESNMCVRIAELCGGQSIFVVTIMLFVRHFPLCRCWLQPFFTTFRCVYASHSARESKFICPWKKSLPFPLRVTIVRLKIGHCQCWTLYVCAAHWQGMKFIHNQENMIIIHQNLRFSSS